MSPASLLALRRLLRHQCRLLKLQLRRIEAGDDESAVDLEQLLDKLQQRIEVQAGANADSLLVDPLLSGVVAESIALHQRLEHYWVWESELLRREILETSTERALLQLKKKR